MLPPSIRRTALAAAVLAFAAPLPAADPEPNAVIKLAEQVGKLVERLDQQIAEQRLLNTKLLDVITKQDKLATDLQQFRREVGEARTTEKQVPALNPGELDALRREIENLKRELSDSRRVTTSSARMSQSAIVRVVNRYVTDVTATVNGNTFIIPANGQRDIAVAPGTVAYQIFGHQAAPTFNTLSEAQMLTVTLRPTF